MPSPTRSGNDKNMKGAKKFAATTIEIIAITTTGMTAKTGHTGITLKNDARPTATFRKKMQNNAKHIGGGVTITPEKPGSAKS